MVIKNMVFILAALMATAPLSAMESNQSIWSSVWKQSKDFVTHAVKSVAEFNADLTHNQRYAIAATVGLAAVGGGYAWFTKKAKPQGISRSPVMPIDNVQAQPEQSEEVASNAQQPPRIKKTVRIAEEKNEVFAIPKRVQEEAQANIPQEAPSQIQPTGQRNPSVVAFVLFIKKLHEALAQDQTNVAKAISRLMISRSLNPIELNTIKVWNENFIDLNLKEFNICHTIYKSVVISRDAKTLEELQKLQRDLAALAKELATFIQRYKNNSKE